MKLPSIQQVLQDATRTFLRFPLVLLDAAIGTVAALILIDHEGPAKATILFNIMFAAILGILLLFAIAQAAEKRKRGRTLSLAVQGIGVALLIAYAFTVPSSLMNAPAIHIIRLLILAVSLIFLVVVAPFTRSGELNGFWHYNKTLLFRLLTAGLFAMVLFAGFSVALAALDQLFGIDVPGKRYAELWLLIVGLFSTWFFLAGVPEDLDALDRSDDYPKGLKIFAQYILSPVVLVYLIILYAYIAKILIAWDWPQGWVSKLILGFSATGMCSLLLLYPIRELAGNNWIRVAWRWFYIILIPLVIMLPLAVWRRVSQYGITEGRYLALALGAWLAVMVVYFIFSRTKSIKVIPASLCLLSLLTCFGSWSVFAVSERSQVGRLKHLLVKNSILVDSKVCKATTTVNDEDSMQISSILAYLHDFHGYDRIQSWFHQSLKQDSTDKASAGKNPADVAGMMGIEYMQGWMWAGGKTIFLSADQEGVCDVGGYDRMFRTFYINEGGLKKSLADEKISYRVNAALDTITFVAKHEGMSADSVQITLHPSIDALVEEYGSTNPRNVPPEKMSISNAGHSLKVKLYLQRIEMQRKGSELKPNSFNAEIFYSDGQKP